YEEFSVALGPPPGAYMPDVDLLWAWQGNLSITMVSLVYPLTQAASAAARGDPTIEALDGDPTNQNSIEEALDDLIFSVNITPTNDPRRLDPEFPIIANWEGRSPLNYLDPRTWELCLVVGMAYPAEDPGGALVAWTDVQDNPLLGDVNGDGSVTAADTMAIHAFVLAHDGDSNVDAGPAGDGRVLLSQFARNFSIYDVNYDGVVDMADVMATPLMGDLNFDDTVDLADAQIFLNLLLGRTPIIPPANISFVVRRADFDRDGVINGGDIH